MDLSFVPCLCGWEKTKFVRKDGNKNCFIVIYECTSCEYLNYHKNKYFMLLVANSNVKQFTTDESVSIIKCIYMS